MPAALAARAADTLRATGHEVVIEDLYAGGFGAALSVAERASYYGECYDSAAVQAEVERLLAAAESQKRTGSVIEILLTQALVHQAQNNRSQSLAALERALARLPRGSALVFRHYHLPAVARRQRGLDARLLWPSAVAPSPMPVSARAMVSRFLPDAARGLESAGLPNCELAPIPGRRSRRLHLRLPPRLSPGRTSSHSPRPVKR